MRGAHPSCTEEKDGHGIIPAYAGSTLHRSSSGLRCRDHPRVCGEHTVTIQSGTQGQGSSPRMRGAPGRAGHQFDAHGIIPAYAGSTFKQDPLGRITGDHPRVCGEHRSYVYDYSNAEGSSPRMRGALVCIPLSKWLIRIIPAYAGSTVYADVVKALLGDHPRVCGEHFTMSINSVFGLGSSRVCGEHSICPMRPLTLSGSSPRMRGALSTTLEAI